MKAGYIKDAPTGLLAWVQIGDWQIDYRSSKWLPLGVREGWVKWHILPLGRLGNITAAPVRGLGEQ